MSENSPNDFLVSIEDIMHTAYLQYSLSVNIGRAIPDVRDGMKPCNRRILYAMRQLGLTKSHATVKCAKVVGEVLGNYHPHGDASVYDTLVRMAQDFSMREPLVEGKDVYGSVELAARELQYWIGKMTGAKIAIVEAPTGTVKYRIFLNSDEAHKLWREDVEWLKDAKGIDGWFVRTKGRDIHIGCAVPNGTTSENAASYGLPRDACAVGVFRGASWRAR